MCLSTDSSRCLAGPGARDRARCEARFRMWTCFYRFMFEWP